MKLRSGWITYFEGRFLALAKKCFARLAVDSTSVVLFEE